MKRLKRRELWKGGKGCIDDDSCICKKKSMCKCNLHDDSQPCFLHLHMLQMQEAFFAHDSSCTVDTTAVIFCCVYARIHSLLGVHDAVADAAKLRAGGRLMAA